MGMKIHASNRQRPFQTGISELVYANFRSQPMPEHHPSQQLARSQQDLCCVGTLLSLFSPMKPAVMISSLLVPPFAAAAPAPASPSAQGDWQRDPQQSRHISSVQPAEQVLTVLGSGMLRHSSNTKITMRKVHPSLAA